jgi:D-alanyl-D-alanine dipeptidase
MGDAIGDSILFLENSKDFVQLRNGPGMLIDLRYASENNFVGYDMYGPFNRAYLHKIAAAKLNAALALIRKERPDHGFIIYDALRPRSIQRILFHQVRGTENEKFLADPDLGSLHNFGFAVDLSVIDGKRKELDMGAGFDDFRPIAQPQYEKEFLRQGQLTRAQYSNRLLLRRAMEGAGFIQLPHEWWHYDALPKAEVRAKFQIVE